MSRVVPSKRVETLQTFGDRCGRCQGSGFINPLGLDQPGICPVCQGKGIASVLETFGNRHADLPINHQFADGVEVTTVQGRRRG